MLLNIYPDDKVYFQLLDIISVENNGSVWGQSTSTLLEMSSRHVYLCLQYCIICTMCSCVSGPGERPGSVFKENCQT